MIDFARARKQMVDTQLRTSNITDRRILAAMGALARERFVPEGRRELAYIDEHLPLGISGRALSAPAPFARLVQLANIQPGDAVLDLGCGTGYSAAVLAALGKSVLAVESVPALAAAARDNLAALGISNVEIAEGALDGSTVAGGPFDVVIVEAAFPAIPPVLLSHLRDQGRLVALVGSGMTAVAHVVVKTAGEIATRADFNARLPVLGGTAATDFVF
jgi:protein-L-isoaspartate(D-aspartate) O-methyltransferase